MGSVYMLLHGYMKSGESLAGQELRRLAVLREQASRPSCISSHKVDGHTTPPNPGHAPNSGHAAESWPRRRILAMPLNPGYTTVEACSLPLRSHCL